MSKVVFKLSKPMQLPHSYSTKSLNKTREKTIISPDNANFKKVTGFGIIGTSGLSPVIIYKKTPKENSKLEKFKIKRQIKNTNYISDGGLKQKLEKYNTGLAFNSSQISFPQTSKNKTTKNKDNKNHNLFLGDKKQDNITNTKKPNFEDIKLFSKTVREFNKRPIFPKTEKYKNTAKNGFWKGNNKNNKKNQNEEKEKKMKDDKLKYMNELYENGIANEIRKYNVEKKMTPKEMFNERKKVCLIDNGVELEEELNNIEEEGNMSEEIKEEEISKNNADENINNRKNKSYSNKLYKSQIEFNHNIISLQHFNNQSMTTKNKKVYKPHVDQFGYIKKIKKEQQKLYENVKSRPKLEIDNYQSLEESFRHNRKNKFRYKEEEKQDSDKKNVLKNNFFLIKQSSNDSPYKKLSEETQSTYDNYPYSHKRSYRKPEELKSFLRLKKMQERENKKSKEIENNKKLFIRFKNLYNLSMKDLFDDQYQKIEQTPKNRLIKSKSNYNYNNSSKKKKEVNEYYIGTEHSMKNNSTLVDQNEYYLHILESQQLLVNSKLKKIDNISDTESKEENDEENEIENNDINNNFNGSKDQINKITEKSKTTKTPSSASSNNGILNLTNFENLKQKIDNTLKRVNRVFSKENFKKLKETSNSNTNNEEYEISNNLNSDSKMNSKSKSKSKEKDKEKNETSSSKNKSEKKSNIIPENNIKDLKVKTHELNIDTTNVNNKLENSEMNTKEKNFPSLSHTYSTNSNQNKKVEIEIESRAILNLVEIIKFLIQRKVFVTLYESYINHSIYQQYNMALSYFVAICKHYPYRKIEEYANYRTYNFAFRQLFRPFIRRALRYFMSNLYMKKKVEYLVLMLTKLFKFKIFEKIYLCNPFFEDDNQRAFKIIIMKILSTLIKPHLKEVFANFRNFAKKPEKIDKGENEEKIDDKNTSDKKPDINIKKEVRKKIGKNFFEEQSYSLEEKSLIKRADVSMKMNTYMYYSSSDESSLHIESNSVDDDKLHQLKEKLKILYGDSEDFLGFNYDGMRLHDNSLELETYLSLNNHKKKKLSLTNSENNSSKKSITNSNSNKKNINKKNLVDEGNNTDNNLIEEDKEIDKDKEIKEVNNKDIKGNKNKDKKETNKDIKEKKPSNFEEKKRNIKIDIEDAPIIKPENKNKHSNSDNDISAENDLNMNISWEYNISNQNERIDKIEDESEEKKVNKDSKKSDDEYGTFEDISLEDDDKDESKNKKEEKKIEDKKDEDKKEKKEEKEKEKENFLISNENKQDKSRNFKQDTKIKNDSNEIKDNIKSDKINDTDKIQEESEKAKKPKKLTHNLNELIKSIKNINNFADDLTNEIIKDILISEIQSPKKKLLPNKKFKFDKFDKMNNTNKLSNSLTNSFGSIGEMRSS